MSTFSSRPYSVATGGPKQGASPRNALPTVSVCELPIAQPIQLTSARVASW